MNPYLLLGIGALWLGSLVGVGAWQRTDGAKSERVVWQEKDRKELAAAAARVKQLEESARATERASVERIAQIEAERVKERNANEERRRRDRAAALNGELGLRISASVCADGGSPGKAGTSPRGSDGAATVQLPRTVEADLSDLTNDADDVADQLRDCQAVIRADRAEK